MTDQQEHITSLVDAVAAALPPLTPIEEAEYAARVERRERRLLEVAARRMTAAYWSRESGALRLAVERTEEILSWVGGDAAQTPGGAGHTSHAPAGRQRPPQPPQRPGVEPSATGMRGLRWDLSPPPGDSSAGP